MISVPLLTTTPVIGATVAAVPTPQSLSTTVTVMLKTPGSV
jgi:hypothetical protein